MENTVLTPKKLYSSRDIPRLLISDLFQRISLLIYSISRAKIKKIPVLRVTWLFRFSGKIIILCILNGIFPEKEKIYIYVCAYPT